MEHEGIPEYINALEDPQKSQRSPTPAIQSRMERCFSLRARPSTSPIVFHNPMRSGMTSQTVHRPGVHGKSCTMTRTPRRKSKKSRARGRTNLVRPMRPAPECPRAQPIATQNLTSWQRTNSIRGGHGRNGRFFDNIAAAATNDKAVLSQPTDNNKKTGQHQQGIVGDR